MSRNFFLLLALVLALQFSVLVYGHGVAEDAPVHAEIARLHAIHFLYPSSYEPLAPVVPTYPPFFHLLAVLAFYFVKDLIVAVKLVGYAAVLAFPLLVFLAASVFSSRTGVIAAFFSVTSVNFAHVYFLGEFPQVLAMDLLLLFLYFYFKARYVAAGICLGLASLSHVFIGPFSFLLAAVLLIFDLCRKNVAALKAVLPSFLIVLLWLPRYIVIAANAVSGKWHNTANYGLSPGLIGFSTAAEYIGRLNPALVVLSLVGFLVMARQIFSSKRISVPQLAMIFLFITTALFTVYHYTPFQLKMLDLLTLPLVVFSAFAVDRAISSFRWDVKCAYALLAVFVGFSLVFGPVGLVGKYYAVERFDLPAEVKDAAAFLNEQDHNMSRILVVDEYRFLGKSELMVSQLSGKIPMDAVISDIEYYPPPYRERLSDRADMLEILKSGNISGRSQDLTALFRKNGVAYVFSAECLVGRVIFENSKVKVCRV